MPNYCYNKLTIKGTKTQMNNFYSFLGSDPEKNFNMQNILPLPTELENSTAPTRFDAVGIKEVLTKNNNKTKIPTNKNGQSEQEFRNYCDLLRKKYGYDNWYDWCNANWGCKWDIDELEILERNDNILYLSYTTAWIPNFEFIKFLGQIFPYLTFENKYYEPNMSLSGIIKVQNYQYENIDLPIYKIVIARNYTNENKYTFFDFDTTDNDYEYFDDYEIIDIIGNDWETAISNSMYDLNAETVENWYEYQEYIKVKFNVSNL